MRRRECKLSKSGGEGSAGLEAAAASRPGAAATIARTVPATAGTGATSLPWAFTKWLSCHEGQSMRVVRWWQQLCDGWWAAIAINICGHERQFPPNSAATISSAIRMLRNPRMLRSS